MDQIEDNSQEDCLQPDDTPSTDDVLPVDQYQGEFLQRKLYFLLEQLKIMHSDLPEYKILELLNKDLTII